MSGRHDNSCAAQDGAVPPPALLGPPTAQAVLPDTSGSGPPDERAPAAPRPRPLRARSLRLGRHLLAIVAFGIPGVLLSGLPQLVGRWAVLQFVEQGESFAEATNP